MGRDRANINTDIWNDDDFRALSAPAQLLYIQLLTSPTLTYAGVADWRPKRIALLSNGRAAREVEGAAEELRRGLYIVIDEDSEEVLIRSFLRWDGLLQKPNVAKAMVSAWERIYSMTLKGVVVHELNRLHDAHPDWRAFSVGTVRELLGKGSVNPSELVSVGDAPLLTTNYLLPTTDDSLRAPAVRVTEEDFDRAYQHWPKKVERKQAFERFKVAAKKVGLEQLTADVIRFGQAYAATTDRQFIPALGVWLNGERWTDELPQPRTSGNQKPTPTERAMQTAQAGRQVAGRLVTSLDPKELT